MREPILPTVSTDSRPSVPARVGVVQLSVDGHQVEVADDGGSLLDALRDQLGVSSAKDGCSPQGQCGCCTVLVDGAARVACVTPLRRMAGREITTLEGLPEPVGAAWAEAFCATGASQCGFCTPGIIVRLEGLRAKTSGSIGTDAVERAMQAHLCRCTGWQTITEAVAVMTGAPDAPERGQPSRRDYGAATQRAELEGHSPQRVGPEIAWGRGGFAADGAPDGALSAVIGADGQWIVAETLAEARRLAAKVQGRRTTVEAHPPLELPDGDWDLTLRTSWVEPAYLETDASWCEPGGEPATPLANGGAFGAKVASVAPGVARALADRHGRPVRVVLSREDSVRLGPKRPPMAIGIRSDGTGVARVARTPGIAAAIALAAPGLVVEEVDVVGPTTSTALRGAGWAEAAVMRAGLAPAGVPSVVVTREGGRAEASVDPDGTIRVHVACGRPLDVVVARSYAIGAAHMALGWVTSEALAVDDDGEIQDLTIRSFGVVRSIDVPAIVVTIEADDSGAVNGSDAVFAAVAAAVWRHQGCPPEWPTHRRLRA